MTVSGVTSQWRTRISAHALRRLAPFAGGGDLVAGLLDGGEEFVRFLEGLLDQIDLAAAQDGQEALLGVGVPEPLQAVADLGVGDGQADVGGSHPLDRVGLVKDDEVVFHQHAALGFVLQGAQEGEEEGVIEHQHVGRQHKAAGLLIETGPRRPP